VDADDRKLIWRCRRGMKELDVLLERYVRECYGQASGDDRVAFGRLLDLPDPDLADYFFGYATPHDPEIARLARLIATHRP
jgi:antitoxin CptB